MRGHMTFHMENENIYINSYSRIREKEVQEKERKRRKHRP